MLIVDQSCYCDNGQCKPKPCVGTCVDGTECGPGCGCLNGECVSL